MLFTNQGSSYNLLRRLYWVAVVTIALSISINQIVVQSFLSDLQYKSRVINVAGRQRMLSQKLSKEIYLLGSIPEDKLSPQIESLNVTYDLWIRSHNALKDGDAEMGIGKVTNSPGIISMIQEIEPLMDDIGTIVHTVSDTPESLDQFSLNLATLESLYLQKMNAIVFQYDDETSTKLRRLKQIDLGLFVLAIILLLIEIFFIFRPLIKRIGNNIKELISAKNESARTTQDLVRAYQELSLSSSKLTSINLALKKLALFATADSSGIIEEVSDNLCSVLKKPLDTIQGKNLYSLFSSPYYNQKFQDQLLLSLREGQIWEQSIEFQVESEKLWLSLIMVPVVSQHKELKQVIVIAQDITESKLAAARKLDTQEIELLKEIKEHQFRSAQILEGQEEERKRIARDIHDGIGQYLTALKYNFASIKLEKINDDRLRKKITTVKALLGDTIKEVRRVSFNLTPNELTDYGFVSACRNFVQEMNKVTKLELSFENLTAFEERLDVKIERNLYRILQEAVNNGLKYSNAKNIYVLLSHTNKYLTLIVKDDGIGFDVSEILTEDIFKISGHGLFNMKERASFIDAKFNIKSSTGQGTEIIIEVPFYEYE